MRTLHIITSLSRDAGTTVFCARLCEHLGRLGAETAIAVPRVDRGRDMAPPPNVRIVAVHPRQDDPWRPDIVHIHGVWQWSLHRCIRRCVRRGIPCVVSTHGMLAPWALQYRAWKKRIAWRLYQKRDLQDTALLHATAEHEREQLEALGLRNPTVIVPLGVAMADVAPRPDRAPAVDEDRPGARCRRVLFLGRLHPIKGLAGLVQAWGHIRSRGMAGWQLLIVGPDDYGYRAELEAAAHAAGLCVARAAGPDDARNAGAVGGEPPDLVFVDPVQDEAKEAVFGMADLLVLPSFAENFGAVVAEALAHGIPAIATRGTPWSDLAAEHCGWWVDVGVEPLVNALQHALGLTDTQRSVMGASGRRLVERAYRWDAVARRMLTAYEAVLAGRAAGGALRTPP